MFTGIIEELAEVKKIISKGSTLQLTFLAKIIPHDMKLGDSVAVNGVCLTVVSFDEISFTVDVMPITYNTTNLHFLKIGNKVNCERALSATSRLGGHFVTGHIDGVGVILKKEVQENAVLYRINFAKELMVQCIEKGSIAIDGTSLTLFAVKLGNYVEISLIPHTQMNTVIAQKKIGEQVNIELDILAKQINNSLSNFQKHKQKQYNSSITYEFLQTHGYT